MKPPDWVDPNNHLVDQIELRDHTDDYIRQLLTATFDEFNRRKIEDKERNEWVKMFSEI